MMKIYFPSLLVFLLLVSCKSQEKVKPSPEASPAVENLRPEAPSAEVQKLGFDDRVEPKEIGLACRPLSQAKLSGVEDVQKALILDANQISSTCMMLQVQYSGCNEGNYHFMPSEDGATHSFDLNVTEAGACEMLIEMMVYIDLESLGLASGPQKILVSGLEIPLEIR